MLDKRLRKLFVIVILVLFQIQSFANGQCRDKQEIAYVNITNLESDVIFHLPDHQNLSHQYLNITYSWDVEVPEDKSFDGFIYCFVDSEKNTLDYFYMISNSRSIDSIPVVPEGHNPFFGGIPVIGIGNINSNKNASQFSECEENIGDSYWVTDTNGTHVPCSYPCEEELDLSCFEDDPPSCGHFTSGCVALPEERRNVSLEIDYGRLYRFTIYPYIGHNVKVEAATDESPAVFCVHHHLEDHGVANRDVVTAWCSEKQDIARHYRPAGPPSALTIYSSIRDFDTNTIIITISWRDPHDIIAGAWTSSYSIDAPDAAYNFDTFAVEDLNRTTDGRNYLYNVTYNGIDLYRNVTITVTPHVTRNNTNCPIECKRNGQKSRLEILLGDYDPCDNSTEEPYCDIEASCELREISIHYLANCTCGVGYTGNGLNPELLIDGTGCQDLDRCSIEPFICSENADCVDASAPSLGVKSCTCRSAYIGDGYVGGSGCVHIAVISFVALVALVVLIAAINGAVYFRRRFKNKMLLSSTLSRFVSSNNTAAYNNTLPSFLLTTNEKAEPVFGEKYEIDRSDITFHEIIGRGNFGVVHKATVRTEDGEEMVAVKSLADIYTADYREDFMAEINLLIALGEHENILRLAGVCTLPTDEDDSLAHSPLMITEYMIYGDLLHFLWDTRDPSNRERDSIYNFTEKSLYKIGQQVAHGMNFLAESKIIHGDVAARNMLVGENLKVKISDFGLANDVYRYGMIKGATERRVPFKWISPERMTGGATPITWKSDVWSFGILLFEMVTLGSVPYSSMPYSTIHEKLKSGYRMPQPLSCSDYLYAIMRSCWEWLPYQRPSFKDLERKLSENFENENLVSRIQVSDEINETAYEMEIGRRDSSSENADIPINGHVNGNGITLASNLHATSNGLTNGHANRELGAGDIFVQTATNEDNQTFDDVV